MTIISEVYLQFTADEIADLGLCSSDFYEHVLDISMIQILREDWIMVLLDEEPDYINLFTDRSLYETRIIDAPDGRVRTITFFNYDAHGHDCEAYDRTETLCDEVGGNVRNDDDFLKLMRDLSLAEDNQCSPTT